MPPEISRLRDRENAMEQNAIEQLLLSRNSSNWEKKLYAGRGQDEMSKRYFKYPLELMSEAAHMGSMVFEIFDTNPEHLATKRNKINLIDVNPSTKVQNAQKAAEGNGATPGLGDLVEAGGAVLQGAVNQYAEVVTGALISGTINPDRSNRLKEDSFVEEATGIGGGTSRVDARIYLYIPNNIQAGYGFEYETTNMSALDLLKLPKAIAEGNAEVANAMGRKLAMANMKTVGSYVEKINKVVETGVDAALLSKSIEASQRQISNPMQLHMFKEVKRRSFTFSYTFLPKNREEMLNCHAIINLFKYYAHPATSGAGRFLDYPAEFRIRFHQGNIINGYLPYIFKCCLKDIKVTYGEESVMATFMEDGLGAAPTKIKLELTFDELEVLTRDRFAITPGAPNP